MDLLQIVTAGGVAFSVGMLTRIWFMLGTLSATQQGHDRRLKVLEARHGVPE